MRKTIHSKGVVTLIFILIIALIATLILVIGQSRIFLALQRNQSATDNLIALYQAESRINDIVGRIVRGLPFPSDSELPLEDGTILQVDTSGTTPNEKVVVTAKRPFSSFSLELSKDSSTVTTGGVEIVMALDCTASMDSSFGGSKSRTDVLEEVSEIFIQQVADTVAANPDASVKLGVMLYELKGTWMKIPGTNQLATPENNIPFAQLKAAIDQGLNHDYEHSPLCNTADTGQFDIGYGGTNIGSAFLFANDYFKANPSDTKRVVILISDGAPNSSYPHPSCPTITTCQNACGGLGEGMSNLKCGLYTTDKPWRTNPTYYGARDPSVDAYVITIAIREADVGAEIAKGATLYKNVNSASQFNTVLNTDIFNRVTTSTNNFTIKRVIPQ